MSNLAVRAAAQIFFDAFVEERGQSILSGVPGVIANNPPTLGGGLEGEVSLRGLGL